MSDIDAALRNLRVGAAPATAPPISLDGLIGGGVGGAGHGEPDRGFLDPEKLPREWPALEAWLVEELE
ncbi:MAG: hypothetical protein IRZ00_16800 [Gemmatimonadetes bacterium]|nr:hypothetical protein [Gemmatimonadota bacterium]